MLAKEYVLNRSVRLSSVVRAGRIKPTTVYNINPANFTQQLQ